MRMSEATVGKIVRVNDSSAHNPGGYGRIIHRSPQYNQVRVDSQEFPGQEVTGWYSVVNVEEYRET